MLPRSEGDGYYVLQTLEKTLGTKIQGKNPGPKVLPSERLGKSQETESISPDPRGSGSCRSTKGQPSFGGDLFFKQVFCDYHEQLGWGAPVRSIKEVPAVDPADLRNFVVHLEC